MGKAYSQDLRERVVAAVDAGTGAYAAASFFRGGPTPKLAAHDDSAKELHLTKARGAPPGGAQRMVRGASAI
jgi:hypothetical protein